MDSIRQWKFVIVVVRRWALLCSEHTTKTKRVKPQKPLTKCQWVISARTKNTIEKGGIFFIECKDGESGDNPHRTGRIIAVKESAVMGVFTNYGKVNYMEQSIFEKFFGHFTYANP